MTSILATAIALLAIGVVVGRLLASKHIAELRAINTANAAATMRWIERSREQGREIAELRAFKQRVTRPLIAANNRRHAEATKARHARMEAADRRIAEKVG